MTEYKYKPRVPVWKYTYKTGPERGSVLFESPQPAWNDERGSIVLRQTNDTEENKVWINLDPDLVERCDTGHSAAPDYTDAHGLLVTDGFGWSLQSYFGPRRRSGGPLVAYTRGERVWVEHNMTHGLDANDYIPVISMDTLEPFFVPFDHVCYVPTLIRADAASGADFFATAAGPVKDLLRHGGQARRAQALFEWPAGRPERTRIIWAERSGETGYLMSQGGRPSAFCEINDLDDRMDIFREEWSVLSQERQARNLIPKGDDDAYPESEGSSGLLDLAEVEGYYLDSPGPSTRAQSVNQDQLELDETWMDIEMTTRVKIETDIEEDSEATVATHPSSPSSHKINQKLIPPALQSHHRCNLTTDCPMKHHSIETTHGQRAKLKTLPHYHVLDSDTMICSLGEQHNARHCILRVGSHGCVLARDGEHSCCFLGNVTPAPSA